MKNPLRLLFGLIFTLTACSSAPPIKPDTLTHGDYSYLKSYLTWLITQEMAKQDIEGLSIAVVDDQQVVWSQGFGYADTANQVKATPETVYRVGSISKLFTDTLVMQLAEQGKLDIDQPLQTYLTGFTIKTRFPNAGPITPRNIMTHHSGLPADIGNGMWTANPVPFGQLTSQLKDSYAAYPPNEILSYSNLGISLLGAMLEQISGASFSAYADQQLLNPLGMRNAKFSLGISGPASSKAYKDHKETLESPLRDMPAGGLNANVLDMSRFMKMVLADGQADGRQILKADTLKEMLRQQNQDMALDFDLKSGLGWFLSNEPNIGMVAGHDGATLYHTSLLNIAPEQKLGVVTLANSRPKSNALVKINDAALKLAAAIKNGRQPDLDEVAPPPATRALTPEERAVLAGQYATSLGYINLSDEDGSLRTELDGKTMELVRREDGQLSLRYLLWGFIPIQPEELTKFALSLRNIVGHEVITAQSQGFTFLFGEKIKPKQIPTSLQSRLGEYEIVNLAEGEALIPEKCALRERDGLLLLEYSIPAFGMNNIALPIQALSENEAIVLGLGRGMRETVRLTTVNGKELVGFSGYLLQKKQPL